MTNERWQLAYAIYEAAALLADSERKEYVEASAPDAEIAAKVLALLDEMESTTDSDAFTETMDSTAADRVRNVPNGAAIGRFVITGFIGQGGMGQVYAAHDPDLDRSVALKLIAVQDDEASSERFVREAHAVSALNHPNIVTVHEVIRSGSMVAIAMELVTGTSLRQFCGVSQPVGKITLWGAQIARALHAAHARGIVHRDIKPENLMLRPDGYVKVLDFGLARQAGASRAADELTAGTIGYLSPEEVLRRPITTASDIFSLGIVLYELASGANPFRGESAGATTALIQGMEPPPLPAHAKGVPQELNRLLHAMLAKSPGDRPAASEVASRLEALAQPRLFRHRIVWVAAALALSVLGGMAAWRVAPSQQADSTPVLLQSLPLTSEPASETDPAFSMDGGSVAYASDSGSPGIHRILTRRVSRPASGATALNPPHTLTSGPQDDTNPVWSPDGSRIGFLRRIDAETVHAIVIPSGGGTEQVIARLPGSRRPGARKYLTWTADGEALVATHRVTGGFALRLYRFPISSGAPQLLTEGPETTQDVSPAYSPDGRWLAFLRWQNGATYGLWAVAQPGGKAKLLVTSPTPITTFAWKPDSRTIVYGGGAMSTGELRQVTIDGRGSPAPFVLEGASDQITIAPKSGRLAYVLQNLDTNIWRFRLDRTGTKESRPGEKLFASIREEMDPAFSSDGKSIAFISNRSGHWNLWTGNADGSGLHELSAQSLLPAHPAWSLDSREIAFDSKASGKSEIWVVNAAGGPPRRLVAMTGGAEVPSWSRDGKRVLFYTNANGSRNIWAVAATGGAPVPLTNEGSYDPSESPDGRYLYYGSVVSAGIWRIPLLPGLRGGNPAGRQAELIRETLPVTGHRFWALGQGGIYFVDAQKSPSVLKFVDLVSRAVTVVATLDRPPAKFTRGLSISPDGHYALYCQADVDRYEIRVVENFQ